MSISAVTSSTTTSTTSTSSSSSSLSGDDFLTLLVEQLQNQNPLDPTDTNEFMGQMLSYASLSQQIETNSQLESLTSAVSSLAAGLDISV